MKTSTGFGPGGATAADVALMRRVVGAEMGVKAAGGVKDYEALKQMVAAGATRVAPARASASCRSRVAAPLPPSRPVVPTPRRYSTRPGAVPRHGRGGCARLLLAWRDPSFGGPVATSPSWSAKWSARARPGCLPQNEFLDLLGLTNLIPGRELERDGDGAGLPAGGPAGLLAGGLCFILPAASITAGLAWLGAGASLPRLSRGSRGLGPAVIGLMVVAVEDALRVWRWEMLRLW